MHRATPANTSFRAYSAGGARSVVHEVDDSKMMQESKSNFMKGETRQAIESPQNYGFTSVCVDGDKDKDGNLTMGPEQFISFIGGNRSFPVAGPMDDRRHRLKGLAKGDAAMYRLKDDGRQFHLTKDGGYWSDTKTVRMALVSGGNPAPPPQRQQRPGVATLASNGGGAGEGAGAGAGGQQQQDKSGSGQFSVAPANAKSTSFVDVISGKSRVSNSRVFLMQPDGNGYVDVSGNNVWLGFERGRAKFSPVLTVDGPCDNVWGRIGGGVGGGGGSSSLLMAIAPTEAELLRERIEMLEQRLALLEGRVIA